MLKCISKLNCFAQRSDLEERTSTRLSAYNTENQTKIEDSFLTWARSYHVLRNILASFEHSLGTGNRREGSDRKRHEVCQNK